MNHVYLPNVMDIRELMVGYLVGFLHSSVLLEDPGRNFHVAHSVMMSYI